MSTHKIADIGDTVCDLPANGIMILGGQIPVTTGNFIHYRLKAFDRFRSLRIKSYFL